MTLTAQIKQVLDEHPASIAFEEEHSMTDFTIGDVLAWARTKPAGETYNYMNTGNCALCQFLRETGRVKHPAVTGHDWRDGAGDFHAIPKPLDSALIADTFGDLVAKIEKLAPETIVTPSEWTQLDAYLTDIEDARGGSFETARDRFNDITREAGAAQEAARHNHGQ